MNNNLKQAKTLIKDKKYINALNFIDNILIYENDNVEALKMKATCLYNMKHYYLALYFYNRALKINDHTVNFKLYNDIYDNAELKKSNNTQSLKNIKSEFEESINKQKQNTALTTAEKILMKNPNDWESLNKLAKLYHDCYQYKKAIIYYTESINLKENYDGLIGKANSLLKIIKNNKITPTELNQRFENISKLYTKASEYDLKAITYNIDVLKMFKSPMDVINYCDESLKKINKINDIYLHIILKKAITHIELKDYKTATKLLNNYLSNTNHSKEALYYRGIASLELQSYNKALKDFNKILKDYGNEPEVLMLKAKTQIQSYEFEDALNCYNLALTYHNNSKIPFAKAELLTSLHEYYKAYEILSNIPQQEFTQCYEKLFDHVINQINDKSPDTGIYGVSKADLDEYNWMYTYIESDIFKKIYAKSISGLKRKVKEKMQIWKILNPKTAEMLFNEL